MQESEKTHPAIDWVIANKNLCVAGLFCLFFLVFFLFKGSGEKTYYQAQMYATSWEKSKDEKSYQQLVEKIYKKRELEDKYFSYLLEHDLEEGQIQGLEDRIDQASYRLKKEFPLYHAFSATSLLMEKEDYSAALAQTKKLKQALQQEGKQEGLLYKFNEFRLAILYQKLDDREKEKIVMENLNTDLPLSEKEISFSDYVENRRKKLRG